MTTQWIGDFGYDENGKCRAVRLQKAEVPGPIDPEVWREAFGIEPPTRYEQLRRAVEDKAKAHCVDLEREYK